MRPVKVLTLRARAPLELVRRVDAYARAHGVTRSDAVRMLLVIALDVLVVRSTPPDEVIAA